VQFRDGRYIFADLLRCNLDDEDAVATGAHIVLRGFTHHSVSISDEEQVESILFRVRSVHRQVSEDELVVLILSDLHLLQVVEVASGVVLVEQVEPVVVVDLEVAHVDRVLMRGVLVNLAENIRQRPGDESAVCVPLRPSCYRERLPGTSLSVGEDSSVVALHAALNYVLGYFIKDCVLFGDHVEDAIEFKPEILFPRLQVFERILDKVELNLVLIR